MLKLETSSISSTLLYPFETLLAGLRRATRKDTRLLLFLFEYASRSACDEAPCCPCSRSRSCSRSGGGGGGGDV